MFEEEDYIMRFIHQMIRSLLKLLFKIEDDKIENIKMEDSQVEIEYDQLVKLIDEGKINEAENRLYEGMDIYNQEYLKAALIFYDYLNELDIDELKKNGFSKAEIKDGITNVLGIYGYKGFTDMFMFID